MERKEVQALQLLLDQAQIDLDTQSAHEVELLRVIYESNDVIESQAKKLDSFEKATTESGA